MSNISEEGILLQGNNLWVQTRAAPGTPEFENMAGAMGVDLGGWSFGAQFGDLNNDGLLDLYLVNGFVSASQDESYWYDYSKVAGGNQVVISDAKNWPAMGDRSLAGYQQKRVWINDGAGRFVDVAPMVGVTDRYDGRSVALADLGRPRRARRVVANQRGPLLLYRNDVAPGRHWIAFALEGGCRRTRRRAVQQPQRDRRAGRRCTGTGSSRCRKFRAGRASARRTIASCTLAWRRARGEGGDSLAVRARADHRTSGPTACTSVRSLYEATRGRRREPRRAGAGRFDSTSAIWPRC